MNVPNSISHVYFKLPLVLDFCGDVFYRLNWFQRQVVHSSIVIKMEVLKI